MSKKLGPLPDTEWLLHMPAQPYESEWTSSMAGYTEEQMRDYAAQEVAKERERCASICDTTPPPPFRPSIEAAHAIRNQR